jgi:hypothetical protein
MHNSHEVKTVKCACCGTVRQEANHWFVITTAGSGFRCAPLIRRPNYGRGDRVLTVPRRLRKSDQPVCGQQCAQKVFERYLAQQDTRQPLKLAVHESWRRVANPA